MTVRPLKSFGGQGSALCGFNHLTGWPDREAVGPHGTITDSLSPRYAACLVAAALFHRERTGEGQHLDLSQIETGVYSLAEPIVRCAARTIATTVLDLLTDGAALDAAKREFEERTGGGIGGSKWLPPLCDYDAPIHHRWPEYVTTERGTEWWIPTGA